MMKVLYDTQTAKVLPWPRSDDEPVVGLAAHLVQMTLVQEGQPPYDTDTQYVERQRTVDEAQATITEGWRVVDKSPEQLSAERSVKYPPSDAVDVRDWLLDQGITALMVEAQIVQLYPDPTEQAKALNRWHHATKIPRDHPLVVSIGAALGFTPEHLDSEWNSILNR